MTSEEKQYIIKLLRQETGLGPICLTKCLNKFITKLKRKPHPTMGIGYELDLEWKSYALKKPLRKQYFKKLY